jgi:hypothetical protein
MGGQEVEERPAQDGIPEETLKWLFGRVKVGNKTYTYSPSGPVSAVWKAECEKRGHWVRLREVHETAARGKTYRVFLFEGGLAIAHHEGERPEVL